MYKLVFFVPEEFLDRVKNAVFAAGAGKIGDYDQCCWQVLGQGQFRPLSGSTPFIGDSPQFNRAFGDVTYVKEYRVEMVVEDEFIKPVIKVLQESHPYEEPAYDVCRLEIF
jgi:hypothetical protein